MPPDGPADPEKTRAFRKVRNSTAPQGGAVPPGPPNGGPGGPGGSGAPGVPGQPPGTQDKLVAGTPPPQAAPAGPAAGQPAATASAGGPSPASGSGPAAPEAPGGTSGKRTPGKAGSGKRMRFARPLTAASIVGWTALSAILPGAAHLRSGRRRIGYILLGLFAALLVAALVTGLTLTGNVGFFTRDSTLAGLVALTGVGALAWFLLVLFSYITLGPNRLKGRDQIISGVAAGVLCVSVMAPFGYAASSVLAVKDTANAIFQSQETANPTAAPIKAEDPWAGHSRVNFLLVGGDAAGNRTGVRTDSMTVASIDVATGNTVLFSLPRNLQHVRFRPGTPLAKRFPNGYMAELPNGGLLNEIWQYAEENPDLVHGKDGQRGPKALMETIGYTLNLKIDYYALINMYGFAHLVDAIGGLKIRVDHDIRWGGHFGTAGTIKAGHRTLSGEEALWYGRSRVDSDDFSRMSRQRCVIGAFAQQATPQVVLTNFIKIAQAAKKLATTNIPRELLDPLTELALKVKGAKITSLQFVPPEFYSGAPDWAKIRTATARALRQSVRPARGAQAAGATASPADGTSSAGVGGTTPEPGVSGTTPTPTPTRSGVGARPSQTPTRNGSASAQSLSETCGL